MPTPAAIRRPRSDSPDLSLRRIPAGVQVPRRIEVEDFTPPELFAAVLDYMIQNSSVDVEAPTDDQLDDFFHRSIDTGLLYLSTPASLRSTAGPDLTDSEIQTLALLVWTALVQCHDPDLTTMLRLQPRYQKLWATFYTLDEDAVHLPRLNYNALLHYRFLLTSRHSPYTFGERSILQTMVQWIVYVSDSSILGFLAQLWTEDFASVFRWFEWLLVEVPIPN